ncbi:MAG TPA: DUF1236 domain-containing protein [Devosiaceae bacterium]
MRKFLLAGVAILALGAASPVLAQNAKANADAAIGGAGAGMGGAALGFVLGGPVGAVIGGFSGAVIGGSVAVSDDTVAYAGNNPVDPIVLNGPIDVGSTLGADVELHQVPTDPQYGYVYTNNRVYIVDNNSRQVVMSPGYAVPQSTVTYIEQNPGTPVVVDGDVGPGYQLDQSVQLAPVPDNPSYSYVYIDDRPALIDNTNRTVVWIK